MTRSGPMAQHERIPSLDAMRGVALFGILFVNMTWFTGFAVMSSEERAGLGTQAIDDVVYWLVHCFVDGKFWSLFALLFGVGFAVQLERGATPARFVRRMTILLVIGLLHAIFVWFGDIVSLYTATGFILLLFARCRARALVICAVALLLTPIVVNAGWLAVELATRTPGADIVDPGHGPAALLVGFSDGSYGDALRSNWAFLVERWVLAVYTSRFPALLGMFLLGFAAVRYGMAYEAARHTKAARRLLAWGLLVGLVANAFLAFNAAPLRPPTWFGWTCATIGAVGIPALALAYASGLLLAYETMAGRRILRLFAPAGRMSLTNYLAQSIIGVLLFYGCGLGWWGRFGITWSCGYIVVLFTVQSLASAWWLSVFEYGPVEWLWRCLTYGRWLSLRRRKGQDAVDVGAQFDSIVRTR